MSGACVDRGLAVEGDDDDATPADAGGRLRLGAGVFDVRCCGCVRWSSSSSSLMTITPGGSDTAVLGVRVFDAPCCARAGESPDWPRELVAASLLLSYFRFMVELYR